MTFDEHYQAMDTRDASYDGRFFTCVRTTGIFCRPSCPARSPKPENIEFVDTARTALTKGYRPCKRCNPLFDTTTPPEISQLIADIHSNPSQKITQYMLSQRGLDSSTVRRWFQKHHGVTFAEYQRMYRINVAFNMLNNGAKVIDAALETGFSSLSGFTDAYKKQLKRSPSTANTANPLSLHRFETPLGTMIVAADTASLLLLEFTDRKMLETELKTLISRHGGPVQYSTNDIIIDTQTQIAEYFTGVRTTFQLPLHTNGTAFQQKTWNALQEIPYGATWTYAEQARHIDNPKGQRPVASANGMNSLAIVIPCRRVVGADGSMAGYGGGVWRKQWLIDHEKKHTA